MSDAGPERASRPAAEPRDPNDLDPPAATVPVEETWRTLRLDLPPPPARVLEVGAGRGALAQRLRAAGYDVTALDVAPEMAAVAAARGVRTIVGDIRDYHDAPFDVVLFTRSLHHIHPLAAALDRASALLRPDGRLIVDDFRFERADAPTATWLADRESDLGARGRLTEQDYWRRPGLDPLAAWLEHHRVQHDVHNGEALDGAIAARFDRMTHEPSAYLYRYLCARLRDPPGAPDEARRLLREEQSAIAQGAIRAIGCRWRAHRPG